MVQTLRFGSRSCLSKHCYQPMAPIFCNFDFAKVRNFGWVLESIGSCLRGAIADAQLKSGWLDCVPWRIVEAADPLQAAECLRQYTLVQNSGGQHCIERYHLDTLTEPLRVAYPHSIWYWKSQTNCIFAPNPTQYHSNNIQ